MQSSANDSQAAFDQTFLKKLEYLNLIARRLVFGRRQALRQSVKKGASIAADSALLSLSSCG